MSVIGDLPEVLSTKVDRADRRAFAALARANCRTESGELRRLIRAYVRGELIEVKRAGNAPAEVEREHE